MNPKKLAQLRRIIQLNNENLMRLKLCYYVLDFQRIEIIFERDLRWRRIYYDLCEIRKKRIVKALLNKELKQIRKCKTF